jgi:hypothetical protein
MTAGPWIADHSVTASGVHEDQLMPISEYQSRCCSTCGRQMLLLQAYSDWDERPRGVA